MTIDKTPCLRGEKSFSRRNLCDEGSPVRQEGSRAGWNVLRSHPDRTVFVDCCGRVVAGSPRATTAKILVSAEAVVWGRTSCDNLYIPDAIQIQCGKCCARIVFGAAQGKRNRSFTIGSD